MGTNTRSCRICLDAKLEDLVAFQTDSDWAHLFEFCTGLSVTKNNAPQYFCKCCSEKLREFSNFKNKCLKSDILWQKIIKIAENECGQAKSKLEIDNNFNDDYDSNIDDGIEYDNSFTNTKLHESEEEKSKQSLDAIEHSDFDKTIPSEDKITDLKSNKTPKTETKQHVTGSRKSTRTIKPPTKFTSNERPQARPKVYDPSTIYDASTIYNSESGKTQNIKGIPVKIISYLKKSDELNLVAVKNRDNVMFKKPKPPKSKFMKNINIINDPNPKVKIIKAVQNLESNSKVKKQASISNSDVTVTATQMHAKKSIRRPQKSNSDLTIKNIKIVSYLDGTVNIKAQENPLKELQDASSGDENDDEKDNQDSDYDPEEDIAYQYSKPKRYHGGTKVKVVKYNAGYGNVIVPHDTKYSCGICKFGPTDSEAIKQHWNMHIVKGDLNCRLCPYIGRDMADMATHRYEHTPSDYKSFKICLVCFAKTIVTRKLEFHYRSEHLNQKGGICQYCNHEYLDYISLRRHEYAHENPWICDHCRHNFRNKSELKEHWINLMSKNKYVCEHCGHGFSRERNMKDHVLQVHVDSKLKCHHCDETFRNKGVLKCHLQSLSGPQHCCETCGKGYTTAAGLKIHRQIHTNTKSFSCDYCQKPFRWRASLKDHIQRTHLKLKSATCKVCSKTFFKKIELKRHMSMHTGIRPVKCLYDQCDKTFHERKIMMKHCEAKHRNEGSFNIPSLDEFGDLNVMLS